MRRAGGQGGGFHCVRLLSEDAIPFRLRQRREAFPVSVKLKIGPGGRREHAPSDATLSVDQAR
jgi:hypothetical protein